MWFVAPDLDERQLIEHPSLGDVASAFEEATGDQLVVDLTDLDRLVVRLDGTDEDLVVAHDFGELVTELVKAANERGVQI